jgi:hypothetical protein
LSNVIAWGALPQRTLTDKAPMILDATCSYKTSHRWPKHATIRMDIRAKVRPDVIGDIQKTNFPDKYFDEVYLDPPHLFRKSPISPSIMEKRRRSGRLSLSMFERYGFFKSRAQWFEFLDNVNVELFRIIKPDGRAHWKLTFGTNSTFVKEEELKRLTNFEIVSRRITRSRASWYDHKNTVCWLTMRPKT